ncbi:hypothetical protein FACS1894182_13280 [Bacteroidia bacterium]|nr:hypothetical protein FACS1894182_13280 [Bacteroidia bacterium]
MENTWNEPRINLPNSGLILAFGIISIVGCCCSDGILGIVFGIVALVLAKSATNLYIADPERYTESSYQNVNTGKICAWIGLIPSILICIFLGFLVATLGWGALTNPSLIYEYFGVQPPF